MAKKILVLNGPNLNLLGQRQPEIYGGETLADVVQACTDLAGNLGLTVKPLQSNHEGQLVDWIQEARLNGSAIILNPGAYSHTSVAILDALNTFDHPIIEVHISNVHKREEFRHHSYVSAIASGVIAGFGTQGYQLAIQRLATLIKTAKA
jgi:3-dehydroquinate dehydratase-2